MIKEIGINDMKNRLPIIGILEIITLTASENLNSIYNFSFIGKKKNQSEC